MIFGLDAPWVAQSVESNPSTNIPIREQIVAYCLRISATLINMETLSTRQGTMRKYALSNLNSNIYSANSDFRRQKGRCINTVSIGNEM